MPIKVPGYGPSKAKIMVVGEAPGAQEEREGRPFVGPAGSLQRSLMLAEGIEPDEVYFTNLSKYRPPNNELRQWFQNGLPNAIVLEGLAELKEEIEQVDPTVICTVGIYPTKILTRKGNWNKKERTYTGITNWRGSILESENLVPGKKVVPTFHPSYLLRTFPDTAITRLDLARVKRESAFPEVRRPQKRLFLNPKGAELNTCVDWLFNSGEYITFDIEYIGSKLLCVGFTSGSDWAVSIQIEDDSDLRLVRDLLLSGKPLCAQNAMFDASILEWFYQIPCLQHIKYDTMIAAHAAYIELPKSLDFLASIYTDQPFYKDMISWPAVKAGNQPISDVLHYNAIDTWVTHEIMEKQQAEEFDDRGVKWAFDHEMSLLSPLWEMSCRGCLIDTEKLNALKKTLEEELVTLAAGLHKLAGKAVNVKSGPQVGAFLFEQMGVPGGRKTQAQNWKADDKTLAELVHNCRTDEQRAAIKLVRESRERRDLISKFCEIELDTDGRMRCHYDPAKTDTGRLSSRKFYPTGLGTNLQNVPKDKRVRAVFVPDRGRRFGYADLERAESLVVAHLSADREMLRIHQPGIDAHRITAGYLFSKAPEDVTEDERYLGKRVRHASNYMMGWRRLQLTINADEEKTGVGISAAEAKVLTDRYRKLHPGLLDWWRKVEMDLRAYKTLYNLLGRRRIFFDRIDAILPNAIAYIPQSTVADVLNIALRRVTADPVLRQLGFEGLLQVHDAIGFQYDPAQEYETLSRLRMLMRVPLTAPYGTSATFTIPVEILVGENWGYTEKWEKDIKKEAA